MTILNLYAGIGGNRRLWGEEHSITSIENNPAIAKIYQDFFPDDKVVVADAHQYLLDHFEEFDFIWSSPPCPTHSDIRRCGVHRGLYEAKYPDMKLYEEIILLRHFAPKNTKWVVENVKPYYKPLIESFIIERHLFWTNFVVSDFNFTKNRIHSDIIGSSIIYGFDLSKYNIDNKRKLLRNCVNPYVGLHILNESKSNIQQTLFK